MEQVEIHINSRICLFLNLIIKYIVAMSVRMATQAKPMPISVTNNGAEIASVTFIVLLNK